MASAQTSADLPSLPEGIVTTGDTAEVIALYTWAEEHQFSDPENAEQAAGRALALARKLDDQQGIGQSLMILGHLAPDLDQKKAHYTTAQEVLEQIGDERALTHNQINLGNIEKDRGALQEALVHYFEALNGFERLGDTEGQARVLNNIGFTHQGQGNLEEALTYYERATELAETLNKPVLLASILNNFGFCLVEYGSYEQAEMYLLRGLALSQEEDSRLFTAGISNNLGFLFNQQGRHQDALPHLFTAERLANELGDESLLFAVTDEIGKAYLGLEQYDRALHYANESLTLAGKTGSIAQQMSAHQALSQIHAATGKYERAFFHHQRYEAAKDSVFTAEKAASLMEIQTRYETEKQKRVNERLEQKNRIQALQLTLLLGGVGGLLLILGVLFYRYRLKQRANRLLEELDIAKSRFFANISHEFRTPLTVILGGLQDMLSGRFGKLSGEAALQHRAMLRNTRQLQGLIDEVLDLGRLEAGKLELEPASGDLVQLLQRLIETYAPLADRNGIDLVFAHDIEHCPRLYDREKLEKIVGNLLSNALKFTPKGGAVRMELHGNDPIEIAVSDTGPGVPEEVQAKIFERFAQIEGGALHDGTGIGLALAKELVELHGGTITLESEPGAGSTFTVRLPLEEVALDDVVEATDLPRQRSTEPGRSPLQEEKPAPPEEFDIGGDGLPDATASQAGATTAQQRETESDRTTVLIIEDNDDVRAYIRRSLEGLYRVLEAADGEAGEQQARSELPDLIVSDVMLPGVDGYELARRLKAGPDTECIPVIMLTARAADEDQTEGYASGAEAYLTKPFSPETLRATIARLLEERRRLQRRLQEKHHAEEKRGTEQRSGRKELLTVRARAVLLEHLYDDTFGIDELASVLGMSRPTFYRRVKQELGLTPNDFVQSLRLEHAHELLASGTGSVSEVAYAVGFKSLSHFTRSFREHYGKLPSRVLNLRKQKTEHQPATISREHKRT